MAAVIFGDSTIATKGGWAPLDGSDLPITLTGIISSSGMGAYTPSISGGRLVFDLAGAPDGGQVTVEDASINQYVADISEQTDTYSVADWDEAQAAITAVGSAGGKTILFRPWTFDSTPDNQIEKNIEYTSTLTLLGEGFKLAHISGGIEIRNTDNVLLQNLDIQDETGLELGTINIVGDCDGIVINLCDIRGVFRNPLGDYSALGAYTNVDSGIRTVSASSLLPKGLRITNCRIFDVKTCTTLLMNGAGGNGLHVTDCDFFNFYSDGLKWQLGALGLALPVRFKDNRFHSVIGTPSDADNPHVDMIQFISNAGLDGLEITDVQVERNIAWLDPSARGNTVQGITSFEDGGGRIVFKNAIISNNLMVVDGNHHLTIQASGGTISNNTLVNPDPDDDTGQYNAGDIRIRIFGAGGVTVDSNITEVALFEGNPNTDTNNLALGLSGATYSYPSAFDGPNWHNADYGATVTTFSSKFGSSAYDKGFQNGTIPAMTNPDLTTTQPQAALDIIKADCDTLNLAGLGTSTITASDLTNALNTTAGEIAVQKTNQDNLNTDNALGLTLTVPSGDFVDQFQTLYDNNVAIEAVI